MRIPTLIAAIISFTFVIYAEPTLTNTDLEQLDMELKNVPKYDNKKYVILDSLKKCYYNPHTTRQDRFNAATRLGHEYMSFISDSSLVYFEKAIDIASDSNDAIGETSIRIDYVKVLGICGFFGEAVSELQALESMHVPDTLSFKLYDAARQLYYYMMGYTENSDVVYSAEYFRKNRKYRNKLLAILDHSDPLYKYYYAEVLQDQNKLVQSRNELMQLFGVLPEGSPLKARVASSLGNLAKLEGNMSSAAHYWTISAINDIKGSIKENTSLQNLAIYLYGQGDIERAYRYISTSMDDANFCNARLRNMEISRNMPLINSAYKTQIDAKNKMLMNALVIETILAVGLVIAVILILYQIRRLNTARKSLKLANSIKEEYMGRFLDLCSIYMERLAAFNKTVARKVSTGQIDDLLKITKSAKFAEEQNKLFYENFDSAFLHIYPTFVDDFNSLLIPEERIEVRELGKLTMELRIFAFLRLGIEDSNKIASFLNYSVNTIYTYRNKIRNKAINRDTFDEDVRKIGALVE